MAVIPGVSSLEVRGLSKHFGSVLAVDALSFTVEANKVTGFLGPNGAGKTTTLRILLGLVNASGGQALVNGVEYRHLTDPTRTVGAVLESSGFHPARTARRHLQVIAVSSGIPLSRVDEVLEIVELSAAADRRVGGFSMGMRQRLELARALLGDPEILILDEPANGLDPQGIAWLRRFLRSFAEMGRVVLISSHLLAEASRTVDDVVILNKGRLAGQGKLDDLLSAGGTSAVRVRSDEAARLAGALDEAGIAVSVEDGDWVVARGSSAQAVGKVIAENQVVITEMSSSGGSLEELFFEMTEERAS